jgi:beta-galactosidase GanA
MFAFIARCTGTLLLVLAPIAPLFAESMPALVHSQGRHALLVDGAPYTVMAAQLHNSSAWPAVLPEAWPSVEALHANTLEAPVYWEQFEPSPRHYDYSLVDALLAQSRMHGVRLILLWFGSWKNGQMHYVPEWMKNDPVHYPRTLDEHGEPVDDMSPYAATNLQADQTAFAALMRHLKQKDGERHTVIMVQVENEPGMIGTIRDHGKAANALFNAPVPAELTGTLHKPAGTWTDAFGPDADEMFNAYGVARYIDQVAAAGKAAYPLPMYVNVWLRYKGKHLPGDDYPSGGATWNVFELWKASAPHIDLFGTDLYGTDYNEFVKVVGQYARPDNPAWISETGYDEGNAPFYFHLLAKGGIGFSIFGVDHDQDTPARQAATAAHARNFQLIGSIQRQVAQAAFDGRLFAAVEQRGQPQKVIDLGRWQARVSFGAPHWGDAPATLPGNPKSDGHVLILRQSDTQFLVTGFNARVELERHDDDHKHGQLLRVEEGSYVHGQWQMQRLWNGDETDYGLNFDDRPTLLRVTVGAY